MALNVGELVAKFALDASSFTAAVQQVEQQTKSVSSTVSRLGSRIEAAMAAGLAAFSIDRVVAFGKSIVATATNLERLDRMLRFSTGSTRAAQEAFSFIQATSERLGISLQVAAEEYAGLAAAARNTTLEGEGVKEIFLALSEASAVMGFDMETMSRVFLAVRQMMSKGVIASQELKLQLGEKLPGAIQMLSRALGISTTELNKMMEQGMLMAEDVLPRMASEMRHTFAPELENLANSTTSAVARMSSAWFELQKTVIEGFVGRATTALLAFGTKFLKFVDEFIKAPSVDLFEGFVTLPMPVKESTEAITEFAGAVESASKKTDMMQNRLKGMITEFRTRFRDLRAALEVTIGKVGLSKWEAHILDIEATLNKQLTTLSDYYNMRLKIIEKGSEAELALTKEYNDLRALAENAAQVQIDQIRREAAEEQGLLLKQTNEENLRAQQEAFDQQFSGFVAFATAELDNFVGVLAKFAMGAKVSFKELMLSMVEDLTKLVLKMAIVIPLIEQLKSAISGIPGGGGGLLGGIIGSLGKAFRFAQGGIIKEPIVGFGLKSGKSYSLGEKGPEIVTPLQDTVKEPRIVYPKETKNFDLEKTKSNHEISEGRTSLGATNNINISISAVDSMSLTELLRRNPQAITAPIIEALLSGDRGLMASMRGVLA